MPRSDGRLDRYISPGELSRMRRLSNPYQYQMRYGWRNPGGVGRHAEYYPPGNHFQNENAPVYTAHFDQAPGNRSEQLASESIGIQRYNAIQGNINAYGAPRWFGFGFGFGGFW
ncbi:MAG: hypothetical protein IRY99_08880 [Isosphaeraceae bacterium]|nr:hypothetical protein [Isosphaeraceae bacterium]